VGVWTVDNKGYGGGAWNGIIWWLSMSDDVLHRSVIALVMCYRVHWLNQLWA